MRGKRREVNGENVILGQIYFVFSFLFNPTARNIEDERVKKKKCAFKHGEERSGGGRSWR